MRHPAGHSFRPEQVGIEPLPAHGRNELIQLLDGVVVVDRCEYEIRQRAVRKVELGVLGVADTDIDPARCGYARTSVERIPATVNVTIPQRREPVS
jgi:hypothetical protein